MADQTLSDFVKEALAAGKSRDEIAQALSKAGWPDDQARDALAQFADIPFPVPVPRPRAYGSAREAFLYIVYFALLGMVAGYIGALAFAWIETLFVDDLASYGWRSGSSSMRWAIASLLVGYPIFLYLGYRLAERRRRDPERRTSRVRVWLTYVTLIFAAVTLIGDLVAVVYQFLSGGLGERFLAKAFVVGVISGAILWNFARDAENVKTGADWPGRILAVATTLLAAMLVIWAFTVVNGPDYARARIADEQRITDIGVLTRLVDCHRSYFGALPESLDAMTTALEVHTRTDGVAPGCADATPADPSTYEAYVYLPADGDRYQLCANFERGWPEDDREDFARRRGLTSYRSGDDERRYVELPIEAGATCFDFRADSFVEEEGASE